MKEREMNTKGIREIVVVFGIARSALGKFC